LPARSWTGCARHASTRCGDERGRRRGRAGRALRRPRGGPGRAMARGRVVCRGARRKGRWAAPGAAQPRHGNETAQPVARDSQWWKTK
jgi:hypothetical protein